MKEERILDQAIRVMELDGMEMALAFLEANWTGDVSAQYYNYLYCFACLCEDKEKGLRYLEEAIIDQGMWYRPEVFDDEDLDLIRDEKRFKVCLETSLARFREAQEEVKSIFTWEDKKMDKLLIALHGNQQNIQYARSEWSGFEELGYQVEYLQSEEIDSSNLFRWEDIGTGPKQVEKAMEKISGIVYEEVVLGGFSAGCNTLLRAIAEEGITCDILILQSPWIPVIHKEINILIEKLKVACKRIFIICGSEDEDCYSDSQVLAESLKEHGIACDALWIEDLGHEFPNDFLDLVKDRL